MPSRLPLEKTAAKNKSRRRSALLSIVLLVGLVILYLFYVGSPRGFTGQPKTVTKAALELTYSDSWVDATDQFDCSQIPVTPPYTSVDCLLRLVDGHDLTNINVLRYGAAQPFTVDMLKGSFGDADAGHIVSLTEVDLNGTAGVIGELTIAPNDNHIRQLATYFDGAVYVVTAFARDKATFDSHDADITAILSSARLKNPT